MKGSYLSLVPWRRQIVDNTMRPAECDRRGGKLSGLALALLWRPRIVGPHPPGPLLPAAERRGRNTIKGGSLALSLPSGRGGGREREGWESEGLPRHDLPQEIEQPGEALAGDVQALPELAVGGGAAGLPVLLSVLPPEVVPERPELAPGARVRLQALDGGRDAARHLLAALPGGAVAAAFLLVEERRPAPPRVSLQGVQEVFETEGLDAQPGQLQEELPQPPGDRGQLAGLRRDQARHQLVVPAEHDPLPVGRRGQGLGRGTEAQEGVVADLAVAGEDVEISGGDGLLDRGLQQLENPEAERIVHPLPLVQEVPDVEEDE